MISWKRYCCFSFWSDYINIYIIIHQIAWREQ